MTFVWSVWWIVIVLLVLGIAGSAVAFILMDKKDRAIIEDFKNQHTSTEEKPVQEEK